VLYCRPQFLTAALLLCAADPIQRLYEAADVGRLTAVFLLFVLLAATQVGGRAERCNPGSKDF
jgi:hypothetical protein